MTHSKRRHHPQSSKRAWILAALFVLGQSSVTLAQAVTVPAPGTPLRKELLNAIRQPVEKELKQAILFEVTSLKTSGNWSFGVLMPKRKDGKRIQYTHTPYAEAIEEGIFDEGISVLWYRQTGVWMIKTYVLGATDVAYGCWWRVFNAPKAIFTHTENGCAD
ncbi:hypothetical protein IC229_32135 [Spirosoma sp. BT702]|uniref:Uncharacterized protein n=1 Tax=Spirosoma profusum TaxID=2771354 RepID=A0A927AVS0_9BACT|nr:hypothetical protein [Spirosoma profusum]MBD2705312.1 hypothetical protein [Spirosoma profusum]